MDADERKKRVTAMVDAIASAVETVEDKSLGIFISALLNTVVGSAIANAVPLKSLVQALVEGYAVAEAEIAAHHATQQGGFIQ